MQHPHPASSSTEKQRADAKLGRPRSLDNHKRSTAEFLRGIGMPMHAIARWLHVSPSTLRREMQRDPAFRQRMVNARDGLEAAILGKVSQAAQSQPGAAKWLRTRYLRIVEGQEQLLRGLKHKETLSFGSASAQKSCRADSDPVRENTDKINTKWPAVMRQTRSEFLDVAQNDTDPTAQNSNSQVGQALQPDDPQPLSAWKG